MKSLRFLAIFAAFGFVSYQLYNLNTQVRDESALSSLIEVYKVISNGPLNLRQGPSTVTDIISRLNGRDSGQPAEVILVSKYNDEWWRVQFTNEDERVVQGFVASEHLELVQSVDVFSLFWNEENEVFEEEDSDTCEERNVSFEDSELVALNAGGLPFKSVEVKDESGKMRIFSGAILRRTRSDGEFSVLTNPVALENEAVELVAIDSIVILSESEVSVLEGLKITVPGLSDHIPDPLSIAERFQIQSRGSDFVEYNCCFEGRACEKFIKLSPVSDALKEVLMFSYQKQTVFEKLKAHFSSEDLANSGGGDEENQEPYEAQTPRSRSTFGLGTDYTNFEDYFLGPRSPSGRDPEVYRLNVQASEGTVKRGPCGSYHYNPENFGGLIGGDRYIKKEVLGCFLATLQEFRRDHPEAKVQWGDISRGDRRSFRPDHSSHQEGRDVDVRPIRADDRLLRCNIGQRANAECYDREMTKAFIDIALRYGGNPIYFNDRAIYNNEFNVERARGHYDHFHIRYTRECPDVILNTNYCPREGFN